MRKVLYVVLDGLGDRPCPELGGKTPLEAAFTPNLDRLAKGGRLGTLRALDEEIAPESDAAVLSLLGYDVAAVYTGRGPLEATGADIEVRQGDLAWRANFATVDSSWKILDRRAGRDLAGAEAAELAAAVQAQVSLPNAQLVFRHTSGHRCVLVIRSLAGPLSGDISNVDPGYRRRGPFSEAVADPGDLVLPPKPLLGSPPGAEMGAELTAEFLRQSYRILDAHPVNQRRREQGKVPGNMVLVRDAGDRLPKLQPFEDLVGASFASLVEMPVEIGICALTGIRPVHLEVASSDTELGLPLWAHTCQTALQGCDGLYVHIKGPDVYGHDGETHNKLKVIEKIDANFFGQLDGEWLDGVVLAVTADHSTPVHLKAHSADPVPLLLRAPGLAPDGVDSFGEQASAGGSLGRVRGVTLAATLVKLARR